jgi:polyisoprenoid-binding protein YceI
MKKAIVLLFAFAATAFVTSCANKADETPDAVVAEATDDITATDGATYTFSEGSTIGFTGSKVTGSHDGGFKKFNGHLVVKDGLLEAGEVVIDMTSTFSDAEKLTGHLKSADFFDVENIPESTFSITAVSEKADKTYELSGNLTLHGVTKNITFPAQISSTDETLSVQAEFDINRKDFGIVYPGKTDDLIRDEVIIKLNLSAKPKA